MHYTTKNIFCQERIKIMEDPEPKPNLQLLKELTIQAVNQCTDPNILDLICKILTADII